MDKQPLEKMEEILNGLLKPAAAMLEASPPDDAGSFMLETVNLYNHNLEEAIDVARNRRRKLVWYEFCLTPEIFLAFDLYPFMGEIQPSVYSRLRQDLIAEFIDAAENAGIPPEICSIDKTLVGAILSEEMPQPDLVITTSAPCDSSRTGYQLMEKLFDAPMYKLDAPFSDEPEAIGYYADQIRDMIPMLERFSGRKFDVDRLREIVEESNRAVEYILEWNTLRRLKPCPTPANILASVYAGIINNLGRPHCTDYCRAVYEFARERAEAGVETGEKIRVVWVHVPPLFTDTIFDWMLEEFGAVVVDDTLSGYLRQIPIDTSSLDSMLCGLAQRGLNMTMGRLRLPATVYVNDFLKSYDDYSGDCAMLAAHAGCKHCWGAANLVRDATRAKDIPLLMFDLDFLDSRIVSAETLEHKIEQFFRTMRL